MTYPFLSFVPICKCYYTSLTAVHQIPCLLFSMCLAYVTNDWSSLLLSFSETLFLCDCKYKIACTVYFLQYKFSITHVSYFKDSLLQNFDISRHYLLNEKITNDLSPFKKLDIPQYLNTIFFLNSYLLYFVQIQKMTLTIPMPIGISISHIFLVCSNRRRNM